MRRGSTIGAPGKCVILLGIRTRRLALPRAAQRCSPTARVPAAAAPAAAAPAAAAPAAAAPIARILLCHVTVRPVPATAADAGPAAAGGDRPARPALTAARNVN
jgi:hypothetical protein